MNECIDARGKGITFSTSDVDLVYWPIEVDEKDKDKTAFPTETGLYSCSEMQFGLENARHLFIVL